MALIKRSEAQRRSLDEDEDDVSQSSSGREKEGKTDPTPRPIFCELAE